MAAIDEFRDAATRGDHEEASAAANTVMNAMGRETPTEIFSYLDRASSKSQHAALVCASSYFLRDMPTPDHREKLLKKAARGPDEELASSAYFLLSAVNALSDNTKRKSLEYLDRAADLGHVPAMLLAANAYETGEFRNRKDLDRAWELLCDALDTEYPPAKLALADFMLRNGVYDDAYDPVLLLEEAVSDGVEGAPATIFARTSEIAMRLHAGTLHTVVPDGTDRITLLLEAICNELHISHEDASGLVADLYGYDTWDDLVASAQDPEEESGPFDEEIDEHQFARRRAVQLEVIAATLAAPPVVIEAIWQLLRPTARTGVPSLRGLDRLVSDSE